MKVVALDIRISSDWQRCVDRTGGPTACWPWLARLTAQGYGGSRVNEGGRWRTAGAHQIAYYVATGRWERAREGRLVRHLCHNRRCCNPAHLVGGTPLDNAADRAARVAGRSLVARSWLVLPVVGIANLRGVAA